MCDDTYIYHSGTQSFSTEEKMTYIKEHERILYERYPKQMRKNAIYCKINPNGWVGRNISYHISKYSKCSDRSQKSILDRFITRLKNKRNVMGKQCVLNKKKIVLSVFIYFVLTVIFYYAAYERICYVEYRSDAGEADGYLEELVDGTVVAQDIHIDVDYVFEIGINVATFMRSNTGSINIRLEDEKGQIIAQKTIAAEAIQDNSVEKLAVQKSLNKGVYILKIISQGEKKMLRSHCIEIQQQIILVGVIA